MAIVVVDFVVVVIITAAEVEPHLTVTSKGVWWIELQRLNHIFPKGHLGANRCRITLNPKIMVPSLRFM